MNESVSKDFLIRLGVTLISSLLGIGLTILFGFGAYMNSKISNFEEKINQGNNAMAQLEVRTQIMNSAFTEHRGSQKEHPDNISDVQYLKSQVIRDEMRIGELERTNSTIMQTMAVLSNQMEMVLQEIKKSMN